VFDRGGDVWGLSVLGPASEFAGYAPLASHAVVAIGNNALRQKLCAQLQAAGFALARVVHPPRHRVAPCAAGRGRGRDGWCYCRNRGGVGAGRDRELRRGGRPPRSGARFRPFGCECLHGRRKRFRRFGLDASGLGHRLRRATGRWHGAQNGRSALGHGSA